VLKAENSAVISDTVSAVDALMAEARNRRVGRVFVINLAPPRAGGTNSRPTSSVTAFNERLQRAASGEGAVYVDIYSAMLSNVSSYIGADGLHPNEAGRKIVDTTCRHPGQLEGASLVAACRRRSSSPTTDAHVRHARGSSGAEPPVEAAKSWPC
jgi:hypothetical protein